jgi:hypothetical protein
MEITVALSWNERKQIEESLQRYMDTYLMEKSPNWQAEIVSTHIRFAATLGDPGIVTMQVPDHEIRWACEGLMYQRSLVTYTEPEPPIGTFGTAYARYGPPERLHLGPLHRKLLKAEGVISATTNPELLTDPQFQ